MTFHMVTLFTLVFHSIIFRTQSLCKCDATQMAYILLSGYTVTARESFLRIWSLCPWRGRHPSGPVTAINKARLNMPSSGHISGNEYRESTLNTTLAQCSIFQNNISCSRTENAARRTRKDKHTAFLTHLKW